jgi:hypothetical protein
MFGGLMFHYLLDFRKPAFQKPIFNSCATPSAGSRHVAHEPAL